MKQICVYLLLLVFVETTHARGHHIQWMSKTPGSGQNNAHPPRQPHRGASRRTGGGTHWMQKIKHEMTIEGMKMAMGHVTTPGSRPCPCQSPSGCNVVTRTPRNELFVFSVHNTNWRRFEWKKITTVATMTYFDDELMCWAHSQGVKIVHGVDFPKKQLTNSTARHTWVTQVTHMMQLNFLDGVNVDFEESISKSEAAEREGLTLLVKELTTAAKMISPNIQITFDFPNHPNGCYGRYYDYKAIADIIDFAFVMDYDEYFGKDGGPNSGYDVTERGMKQFKAAGIPGRKLVLGAPWYGYWYKCATYNQTNHQCKWSKRSEVNYEDIVKALAISFTGRMWDHTARSPFFAYKNPKDHAIYQVWYDDPDSLRIKFSIITYLGLRGAGNWQADALNYSNPSQVKDLWGAFP